MRTHDSFSLRLAGLATFALGSGLLLAWAVGGCVRPGEPALPPPPVRVEFINETGLDLTPNFYYSDTAGDAAALFVVGYLNTSFIERAFPEIPPRASAFTVLECSAVRSLGVRRPRLFNPLTLEVTDSADEVFLLRDVTLECGATVRFAYFLDGPALRVRLEVE